MIEERFIGGGLEKTYTQEELKDAVNKATCEAYDRAKTESAEMQTKYNALRRMLRDLSGVFGDGDT